MFSTSLRGMLATCCLLCPTLVFGQVYGRPMQDIPREQLRTNGTLKNLVPGKLHVADEDGGQWVVYVEQQTREIGLSGSADAAWLRPGMFVEFKATVNAKGETTSAISSATVMTPDMKNPPGVFNAVEGGKATELFTSKEEDVKKDKTKGKPKRGDETYDVRVVGQIERVKDGKAIINAGGMGISAEIDEKARISVDLTGAQSLMLARPNDKIEVHGWYPQGQKGQAWANRIQVTAAQPFTGVDMSKKKPLPMAKTTEKQAE